MKDGPHVVILRSGNRVEVVEFDNAREAHEYAQKLFGEPWEEVLVSLLVRRLSVN